MSSEAPADVPSPAPDLVAALTRERGAPLLEALERHLPGAGEHAEATGSYAFVAAAELGQSRGRCELQRETARLHEIGLVYVPRAMLDRPAAELGAQDAAVIEAHFEAGFRLARGAGVPEQVCGWLLRTRERYDGFGPRPPGGCGDPDRVADMPRGLRLRQPPGRDGRGGADRRSRLPCQRGSRRGRRSRA